MSLRTSSYEFRGAPGSLGANWVLVPGPLGPGTRMLNLASLSTAWLTASNYCFSIGKKYAFKGAPGSLGANWNPGPGPLGPGPQMLSLASFAFFEIPAPVLLVNLNPGRSSSSNSSSSCSCNGSCSISCSVSISICSRSCSGYFWKRPTWLGLDDEYQFHNSGSSFGLFGEPNLAQE